MLIEMRAHLGDDWPPTGGTIDVPKKAAKELMSCGYAVPASAAAKAAAVVEPAADSDTEPVDEGSDVKP